MIKSSERLETKSDWERLTSISEFPENQGSQWWSSQNKDEDPKAQEDASVSSRVKNYRTGSCGSPGQGEKVAHESMNSSISAFLVHSSPADCVVPTHIEDNSSPISPLIQRPISLQNPFTYMLGAVCKWRLTFCLLNNNTETILITAMFGQWLKHIPS